jgi:uncharacterized protein YjiS (DUF1127 family)
MPTSVPASIPYSPYGVDVRPSGVAPVSRLANTLRSTLDLWHARRQRRQTFGDLAEFNEHLLKDIGVSRDEAVREAAKWFWQK